MKIKQCPTCPWKVSSKCSNIPNYSRQLHENLQQTIAESDGNLSEIGEPLKIMACHYSDDGNNIYCAGWLHNQLGVGNNIPLRMSMRTTGISEIVIDGEQIQTFEETFE